MDWVSIDLHMHTDIGVTRDGRADDVKFSYVDFVKVVQKHDLKLMATTNHNVFVLSNYLALNYLCSIIHRKILPGVEIDSVMDDSTTPLHMVIIFKDGFDANFRFSKFINAKTREKAKNVVYSHKEIVDIIKGYDSLIIPHGDKDKGMFKYATEENIKEALKKVREGFIRIFDNKPSNWKLEKIKSFLSEIEENNLDDFGGVLFSDVRDWSKYDEKFRDFKMNANPSFKGLIHSTSNPTKRFAQTSSINYNHNYIAKIVFKSVNPKNVIENKTIKLNRGFNCIIGKSGSGKSLLIEMIKNEAIKNNPILVRYPFVNHSVMELYNENNIKLDETKINVSVGANLYTKILAAYSKNDSEDLYSVIKLLNNKFQAKEKFSKSLEKMIKDIKEYCELVEKFQQTKKDTEGLLSTYSSNLNEKINLKNVITFTVPLIQDKIPIYKAKDIEDFSKYENDINELNTKLELYKGDKKALIKDKISTLSSVFNFAKLEMEYQLLLDKLGNNKILIINSAIKGINKQISTQSSKKSELAKLLKDEVQQLAVNFAENFMRTNIISNTDLSQNVSDFNSIVKINDKYNITVSESIDGDNFTKFHLKDNNIFNTHGKKQMITNLKQYNLTKKEDAKKVVDEYIKLDLLSKEKVPLKADFDVKVKIKFNNQDISNLNPGDIAKTYISVYFEEEVNKIGNHVVLFDQIENDVDKEFISSTIKELIENTKGNIQTIIVTHDPIIAVNADPNNYIEAVKKRNKIEYRNFCAESDERDELEIIARNVDGSKDVIRRRYEIYEGERKWR